MSSNGETLSEKPKGVDADSFPGPIKPTGTSYVSSGLSNGDPHSKKTKSEASVSSGLIKPSGKTGVSSGLSIGVPNSKNPDCTKTGVSLGVRGKAAVSSRAKGKAIVSAKAVEVMSFKDVKFGAHGCELRFRLIHLWEARNVVTKTLIGLEMFLIDQEETVIQGFIPAGRIDTYLPHMKVGGIYRLNSFYGSNNKTLYRVAEPSVTITFSSYSVLSDLEDSSVCFPEDRFRFHGYEEFDAACDLRRDLYDYVGHIKLVNGQVLNDSLVLDDAEIASSRRVLLHVQTHDGPVMKLYLWDKAASDFSGKFKASGGAASVILVTTLNPKRFGGVLTLSSMTSSRVFLDSDVQATRDYLTWLNSNMDVADIVSAEVVTKTETVTIGELFSYMKQEAAKVAWFECIATVGDVVHGSRWYYIGCGVCHTKATKGPTTLMCKKCGKSDIVGVAQYLAKISVYDNDDQACFVLLGDAGQELTGKKASELVDSYFEANENMGDDHLVPVPQALINTIGQTRKFIVKVSTHNLTGKTQSLTVTKVLIPEDPEIEGNVENVTIPDAQKTLQNGIAEDGPSTRFEESGGERVKRTADNVEAEDSKRAKCG
ncbi:replication protein A 70 kDa DNA-binding subunit E-like [Brassica napus]|uniref:replication protein A 70 kDa DNA-binding subunit E-like n=1 Tax=Brassica napus TaxID=3708 RepID=UPI0006AB1BDF|nr:replication protein A 70 kDa DNA-binding subunit E-like [Brassica napus]XP_048627350.1 replication protein A 70 kDa DNA-binding subunit E-like [Brassica napus]